ncbi:polycystin family receptor for egg jelly-like isoform X1 [Oculina patagonica]
MNTLKWKLVCLCVAWLQLQRLVKSFDECTDPQFNNCDQNAACTNLPEGFSCTCKDGFDGNGIQCTDVDECSTGAHTCSSDGACVNTEGTYACDCEPGLEWYPKEMKCRDINECSSNTDDCSNLATCTNTVGSYLCECIVGYTGDGVLCTDLDECSTGAHTCSSNGACVNSQGTYSCDCGPGLQWSSNNMQCQDIDECSLKTDDCSDLAKCINTDGSFLCDCIKGYTGEGGLCTDLDECSTGAHTCSSDGACINEEGTYACDCEPGLKWSPNKMKCIDVDECSLKTDNCSSLAECTNAYGSYSCECITGFIGDGFSCTGPWDPPCAVTTDVSFLLNAVGPENVFAQQKMFLQLVATKFILSDGHRLAVSVYGDTVEHQTSLDASKDNKEILAAIESLTTLTGQNRLDLAIRDVFNTYFNADQVPVSANAKVMVLVVSDSLNRSSTLCPSYIQPAKIASQIKNAGVRVIMAAVAVNISEDFHEFFESNDEIWYFRDYDELISAAGDFSMAVCEAAVRSLGSPYCSAEKEYCQANAECQENGGNFRCNCKAGFKLDGALCVDFNECSSIQCPDFAYCVNTAGSYICICQEGFGKDGSSCVDMNGSGKGIYREVYTSINGDTVEELYRHPKFPESPDFVEVLTKFDVTLDDINGYGQRLSTFYESPETGSFVFSLACTSACELWLSGDEVEANMTRMVKLEPWESTDYQQWEKFPNKQMSRDVQLSEGSSYFLRVNMKAGPGLESGHVSVGVQTPSGSLERPLSYNQLHVYHDVCASQVESCQSNAECINRRKASVCSCVPGVNEDSGLCHAPEQCPVVVDLVFLLDTSSNLMSTENFERQKLLIQRIISRFNVTSTSRISIIPYSDTPHEGKILSTLEKSVGEFAERLHDIQLLMGGCSRHDLALNMSYHYFLSHEGPAGGQRVLVLLTTGKQLQHPQITPQYIPIEGITVLLKEANVITFAIGIGDSVQVQDLKNIATEPSKVILLKGFDNVTADAMVIYKDICKTTALSLGTIICPLYAGVTQCQEHAGCVLLNDTHQCVCDSGFSPNGTQCLDVDECLSGSHKCDEVATCVNTEGSYTCKCPKGYVVNGTKCDDVDECLLNIYICHEKATCVNTIGWYNCSCISGLTGDGRRKCSDINECEVLLNACHKDAYCTNNYRHYECTCVPGYSGNGTVCTAPEKCQVPVDLIFAVDASGSVGIENYEKQKDFIKILASRYDLENSSQVAVIVFSNHASNEIQLGSSGTALSFATAVDNTPYFEAFTRIDLALRLAYDEYFLTESSNETERLVILLTDGKQTRNDFMTPDYIPIEDTVQLLRSKSARIFGVGIGDSVDLTEMRIVTEQEDDIFLATEFNELVAKADFIAKTTCAVALQAQGVTVCSADVDITSCHFGAHCVNMSNNFTCICKDGFVGNSLQCQDIDECADGSHGCHVTAYCVNTIGSYYCSCNQSGYSYNGSMCVDIDECVLDWDDCDEALTTCVNTPGSFLCFCDDHELNYAWDGEACVDIDECAEHLHECSISSYCVNTLGSYNCSCKPGYSYNGSMCADIDECVQELDDCDKAVTKCINSPGSYICSCYKQHFAWNGETCVDVDECGDPARCAENATCINLDGSYECNCSAAESHLCFGTTLCDNPRVRITNVGRTIDQPTVVQVSSYYTFETNVELRCAQVWTQDMSWILADPSLNDAEAISNGTVISAKTNKWTLADHHLAFAHELHALYFSLTVIQGDKNVTESAYDKGYIIIRPSPLVAIISGETEITRGSKQNIILNGSQSYDPHVGPGTLDGLTFNWLCKKSDEQIPAENLLEIQVVAISLNGSEASDGGCFGTGVGRLESTEPVVVLNASAMQNSSASYVFQLIVAKDARTANDMKTVHVVEGNPPEVSLKFLLNDRLNVIPSAPLTISADYVGYSCDDQVEYQWILYEEGKDVEWVEVLNNAENSKVFTIDPNFLKDNTKYRLELTVLLSNGTPSTSVQVFKTAVLPRDGSCTITPDTGEAVYTLFELLCFGWFALNETFTYEVQIIGEGDIHYTLYYGLLDKQQLVLPQGNASRGYLSHVKVFVTRSNGATSELEIPVTVTPPNPKAKKDLFELLERNSSSFEEYLNTLDTESAWQLMTAMLLTIEKQALANSSFPNSTVSSQQKIALRDIALRSFQVKKLGGLPGLVFISAFLATAGKNVTELYFDSKDLLPEIFGNLSNILLAEANNMNAKDERFISQGVYNTLYGTVQLLMVSAEASKVTDDSETSVNRSKEVEIVLKSIGIIKTLLRTVATRSAVSQPPQNLQVPGINVMLGRETTCGLEEKGLNVSEDQGFALPQNMRQAFRDAELEWVEYQMLHMNFNPYQWHESHKNVKSEIMSLEFTDSKGIVLPVGGNNLDIDIRIPLNSADSSLNNFFVRPLMMRYHTVELTDISDSMILEVKPVNRSLMMIVYVKYGERPTVNNYSHTAIIPDYSSCSWANVSGHLVTKCSKSPYEIMSTADFSQTGLYYVGVLYVERSQLNHTRIRRSCFGGRRQKRDCVEPKPPPVKGTVYNRTLTYNPTTDQNYSVKVRKYSCYYFSLTQDQWDKDGCKVGDDTNDQLLHCRCNHLTSFGGGFLIAPNPIDFDKVITEFSRLGETGNYVVLATVCSIFGVYLLVLIWARKADMLDERKLGPAVHVKPTAHGTHTYDLTISTGVWRNAGSTASVFIKIFGTEGIVEALNLTESSPPGRKMFGRGSIDRFIFHLENSLGIIVKIEMWHDNFGKNSSWFLDQVRIVAKGTGEVWDFFHHNWLALNKGDGSTKVTLMSNDPNQHGPGFKNMFYSVSSSDLADYHLWASVVTRPPRNPFTRVQRASCCLSFLYLAMVCNAMFYQVTGVSDEVIQIGPLKMSLRQVIIGLQSALIVAPASVLITVLFRRRKAKASGKNEEDSATGNNVSKNASSKDEKKPFLLPHAFVYLGWLLCFAAIGSSATITVFYSLQWGKQIADQWLASVVVSCVKDVFVWQPCKVLFFTLLLIIIFNRPKSPEEISNNNGASFAEDMKELRAYELQKATFFRFTRQFGAFMVFYVLLMTVTYGDKDYHRYLMNKGTRDSFTFFYKVNTGEKMWIYMLGKFIHDAYAGEWYNGQMEQTPEYIGNKFSMLIGMPRLRQLRIQEDSCRVVKEFEKIIDKCYDFYSMSEEDTTRLYLPHWIHLSDAQHGWANLTQLCPMPWRYSSPEELNNFPSWAQHHIYDGGGYVLDLGYDKPTAIRMMEGVKDKDWIDRRTRAILLEFQVLNLNTNLMSIVTYHYEVLPFGFGLTYEKIDTIKIFNFGNLSYSFYLTCQLLFMLIVLVYVVILLMRLCRQRCDFFKRVWNWVDIGQIMSASLAIVFYIIKVKFMHDSIQELRQNPFVTVSFQFAVFWTEVENAALSLALFIATFKILHFIRLNPHVQILAWTIITARHDIFSFCALFSILFVAHAHFAFLAFGSSVFSFSSFFRSFASEFELSLGNTIHVVEINDVNRLLGSLFTASFMLTLAILLVNIFVSILDINLHDVKEDEERVQEAFGMGKFIKTFLFGFNNKKSDDDTKL